MKCSGCGRVSARAVLTNSDFKAAFKVGDTIVGWSTEKEITITAIGETRFLYRDLGHKPHREKVASMQATLWRKAEVSPSDTEHSYEA